MFGFRADFNFGYDHFTQLATVSWNALAPASLFESTTNGGVGGTVVSESALRSAGTLLSRIRAPLAAPWPDEGPKSLRSSCCGLAT
ncbi:hypothetical protein PoB_002794100 [Plakobranchus ocellatus]|uniref:Uncharacterized protein n=1 Tax=Plakobranchus ocellatus TaxID=259542 RepID=A0AAV3ZQV2_9GAST|nr:hypothetical protein PoB_002794100 [Plakobranchus ocellatus]